VSRSVHGCYSPIQANKSYRKCNLRAGGKKSK
jgi:hypothetical protein